MLTTTEICDQYARLYTNLPIPGGEWNYVIPTDGCYAAIKFVSKTAYVMFRGSVTPLDWFRDMQNFAVPFFDPKLGWVHNGFREGVLSNVGWINELIKDYEHVVIVGHSLGAGHACLYAAYRLADGLPVDEIVNFGEPRPGGPKLTSVLMGTVISSYRNADNAGHDAVTDVPYKIYIPVIGGIMYEHPRMMIDVSAPPPASDKWGPFAYHHFGLYCKAFNATGVAATSLQI